MLLVLLAAGLAAWLVLGGSERTSGQRQLIDSAVSADVGDAAPLLGSASLAGDGASTAEAAALQARLGPWVASLLVEGPDGTPVVGAQVTARSTVEAFALAPHQGRDVARARTGVDGRVHLGALPTPTLTVLVTAPGFAPRSLSLELPQPGSEAPVHRVRLWPPGTVLHVVVHAQDGTPLSGAEVLAHGSLGDIHRPPPLFTDAAGRAELALGMWRDLEVVVRAPGYLQFRTSTIAWTLGDVESLDVTLQRAREVSGQLVANPPHHVPADVTLSIWTRDVTPAESTGAWIEKGLGDQGRFRIWASPDESQAGLKLAAASASHGPLGVFEIDLTKPTTQLRFDLTPALSRLRTQAVYVEHADGRPAIGLVIEVPVYLASGGRLQLRAVLDDIGHAELPWPPDADEPDTLAVYDALGIRQQLGSQDKADGVWSLRPYGAAHGFVAASDGSRPESAVVGFYPAGGQPFWQFRPAELRGWWRPCDARGEFTCAGLAPGPYYVMAGASTAERAPSLEGLPQIDVKAGEVTEVGTVTLAPRRIVSGHVRDARGKPVAGLEVYALVATSRGQTWAGRDETDQDGAFQLPIAQEGQLRVGGNDPRWKQPYVRSSVSPEVPIEITLTDTPLVVVRFERRTPPDGAAATLCLSPVGEPQTHAVRGTIFGHELRVQLPANLEPETAYEGWIECGDYLGDITPLPTDLSGPGPHVIKMWTRLPEDDDE